MKICDVNSVFLIFRGSFDCWTHWEKYNGGTHTSHMLTVDLYFSETMGQFKLTKIHIKLC